MQDEEKKEGVVPDGEAGGGTPDGAQGGTEGGEAPTPAPEEGTGGAKPEGEEKPEGETS